ncbi:MAG: HDOD domain-containing protein [Sedimentisphaerales bacterium]|nr:HDOD domain-containing protein [Sedimentisphaerales bacterium]
MSEKLKILFVDDEAKVLEGLRRMLFLMMNQWDISFAPGGQQAMDLLAEKSFDILVSDMRMPEVDGVMLLNHVKEHYPHIVRIALSGQTSKESILRSVGPIHQYIAKPCNAQNLKDTIHRIWGMRNILTNDTLKEMITQLETLPCMSSLYTELTKELNSQHTSIDNIAGIISRDVGMSVKILHLVNSAFFGIRQNVTKITQAVSFLGLETISALVLTTKIFEQFQDVSFKNFSINTLWQHSLTVAEWARLIAKSENASKEHTDYAMIAGMLHDVGKLVMAVKIPDQYKEVLDLVYREKSTLCEAETRILGASHAEVGSYLLGLWGFSGSVIEALNYHHHPGQAPSKEFTVLTAVHVANALTNEIEMADNKDMAYTPADLEYLDMLGLKERLSAWRENCPEHLSVSSKH